MPFTLIPFLLLFVPILEIAVFIMVGGQIGVLTTLALILLTAIVGSILLRVQGFSALNQIQIKAASGDVPGKELVHGVMIMIAGVLLLTPGFVTDAVGFLLFFPPFRQFLWTVLASNVVVRTGHYRSNRDTNVVDLDESEYSEKPKPDSPWKP